MRKKNPVVSFVIRIKNEERFIGKVLSLLYKQTFKDFEIIIVDSGSTDKTLEIVKKFPVMLVKIKPKDFNFSYALNLGISKAKGRYICIISGHSIPVRDKWLESGLKNFRDKRVAGVTGYYTSLPIGYYWRWLGRFAFLAYKNREDKTPWMTNTNAIIRKDLWKKYPFDEKLEGSEDYDWAKEMIARGYNVVKHKKFSVFHSHFLLGRPGYYAMLPIWGKWNAVIDKKERPSKSFTKIK